ncbi:endo alpha-1,4 polygalactosaminidase [Paenibacillus alginolyticus]|uniref:Endo alpha-1,4 polygalactosaminidase n=1 Tax=Paenibacillus alginolyticus TaxID=59839 RepID=A0ABT4GED9_9BACL|nr:endo alpha-1,4 polygalactosaminidase [Paenibacillus alginolyticus]MCY9694561.1 endo alpha-1,4 polygalactosaminidase [Paenibacillus alginolyticus]MEC0148128.1 endo alpha-1,4 polygalactosaminidase [Paenibacillus alginolyticus]
MKTSQVTAAIIVSMVFFSFPFKKQVQASKPFQNVKDYSLYYGAPTEQAIMHLKSKDLIIIEPQLFSKVQIQDIQSKGTIVIGYISVMETPSWNSLRVKELLSSDYLLKHGERVHFKQWDSYLMDLRQLHYRQLLLSEIKTSISDKGLDGMFLDTVGDIDDWIQDAATQTQTREAYRSFLHDVSNQYPELSMIQNRGFDTLDYALPYMDGLLWEDWRANWKEDTWMRTRVDRLRKEQKKGLTVFSIQLTKESSPGREARKLKFLHIDAPNGYSEINN